MRSLFAFLLAILIPVAASGQAPDDSTCFHGVPTEGTTWGALKARFGTNTASVGHRGPLRLNATAVGRYVFWSDEHVDTDPVLGPTHKAVCTQVYDAARSFMPRFALMGGDMTESSTVAEWDSLAAWLGDLKGIARPTPGNHEGFSAGGLDRYAAFAGNPGWSSYGLAYCFDDPEVGVRFVAGSSSSVQTGDQNYFTWLEEIFRTTPDGWFLIYYQHYPPFSLAVRGGPQTAAFDRLVPLVNRYKVDAFLAGHSHYFEVYRPGETAPFYFVAGGAGMELSTLTGSYPGMVVAEQARQHHYLEITIDIDAMTVRAVTVGSSLGPGGVQLGTYTIPRACIDRSGL